MKLLCHGYFQSAGQTILAEHEVPVKIYKPNEENTTIGKIDGRLIDD